MAMTFVLMRSLSDVLATEGLDTSHVEITKSVMFVLGVRSDERENQAKNGVSKGRGEDLR